MSTHDAYLNPPARHWRTQAGPAVVGFHQSMPGYAPTRLVELPTIAEKLGVDRVFVKEEAARFGLPAFKILGASYAIARLLSAWLGLREPAGVAELRDRLGADPVELVAATDGNHGRAVAHMAGMLGLPTRIFTPAQISTAAKEAIEGEGADRVELDVPYDEVVRAAAQAAGDSGGLLVQDTSWEGYEQVPAWIVDGYTTLLVEADEQLRAAGADRLDLVAVPVGVGSLAQAVVRHYRSRENGPSVLGVEPDAAPAMLASLSAGALVSVPTSTTIMAGLNCGTPTRAGWPVLQAGLDAAVTVTEQDAADAVEDLAALAVDAGPCGAASLAGVRALADHLQRLMPDEPPVLPSDATVLLLSTESRSANPVPVQG